VTTALILYNLALEELGVARIAATSDSTKSARELTAVYTQVLAECLQNGDWNFAMRTTQEDSDATPSVHNFTYKFTKPTDWVRTSMISLNNSFSVPLEDFEDEAGFWYGNTDPMYVKYVSDDATSYGGLLASFPALYERYVASMLALRTCIALTGSKELRDDLRDRIAPRALANARSRDAQDGPARRLPQGRLVSSRGTGGSNMLYNRQSGLS